MQTVPPARPSVLRRGLNVLFAAMLFPASALASLGIGRPIGQQAVIGFQPEIPAGYAFSIWGPIFALTVVYAIRQALPSQASSPLYARIGWATVASSACNTLWMVLAQTIGNGWWLVVIIFAILAAALTAFFGLLAMRASLDRFDRWLVLPMTAMLAAWLSAAVWLNVAGVTRMLAPDRFGLSNTAFAFGVLAVITVFGWSMLRRAGGNGWFAATLIWALVGVVVANLQNPAGDRTIAMAAAGVALLTFSIALLLPAANARARSRGKPLVGGV